MWLHRQELHGAVVTLDLDALEALAEAATEGPWCVMRNGLGQSCGVTVGNGMVLDFGSGGPFDETGTTSPDAAFIASARTAVPELIAEVRRLRAIEALYSRECDAMQTFLRRHKIGCPGDNVFEACRDAVCVGGCDGPYDLLCDREDAEGER